MAIYKLPVSVSRITGSRLGITIQKAGTNFIIRKRAVIVQKRSPRQSVIKSLLASRSQVWRSLSDAQQATWLDQVGNYSRVNSLGVPYDILANPLQISTNVNTALNDDPPILEGSAPVVYPVFTVEDVGILVGAEIIEANIEVPLQIPTSEIPPGFSCKLFFTSVLSSGSATPAKVNFHLVKILPTGFNTLGVNFWSDYNAVIAPIVFAPDTILFAGMVLTSLTNYIDDDLFLTNSDGIDP